MTGRRVLLAALTPVLAWAHAGEPLQPHDLWTAWRFEPGAVIPLALSALLYARGARVSRGATAKQMACFWTGWTFLALALVSPLHPLGASLFSAHMGQHEVLMLIAAPLLVLSRPLVPLIWGLPFEWRRSAGRWSKARVVQGFWAAVTAPFVAWWIHAAAIWTWHVPRLFEATLYNEWMHNAQHLSFFISAMLFWWSLFYSGGPDRYGTGLLYLFTTGVHTSILGALLTFAPTVFYPAYGATVQNWHLTALEDQQIGGLIMWIPGGLVYLGAALFMFAAWLKNNGTGDPAARLSGGFPTAR